MVRFLFMTDTHLGSNGKGFQQQPAYPDLIGELLDGIREVLKEEAGIDFILHGGDMVDSCTESNIEQARESFRFEVPLYLSVGNHDLDQPDAKELWLGGAPEFFAHGSLDYTVDMGECVLHVMPNQWEPGQLYYWKEAQVPFFTDVQMHDLEAAIGESPDRIHILSVHNPVFGIMPQQTGLDKPIHEVDGDFRRFVLDLMHKYPQLKCVLSGHNHIHSLNWANGGIALSSSSLIETPFEYKIVTVDGSSIRVETHRVPIRDGGRFEYNEKRGYVQGRPQDREAVIRSV